MTNNHTAHFIQQFNEEELKEKATFAILPLDTRMEDCYIKANREGLELFAIQLLKASRKIDDSIQDGPESIIILNHDEPWIEDNSQISLQYIQPVFEKEKLPVTENKKPNIVDKIMPVGCIVLFIFLVIATITGIVTIFRWL
ncbi:hypothetical protein ACFS6H_05615 [Terrimonas rubra]|uniref:CCDC81-like prokaryotic HU domain-containing protein n=1 Tax=Terrimonas rubra TaxID=1035890 RepID=A0ABW6A1M5_9BACT